MDNKATILVVEDNELNMKMAKELLDLAGFETLQAEDAYSGMTLAELRHPDLVLMDMHLPICDGYEATRLMKANPELQSIPVVAFTALAMDDEQKKAMQSGCSGIICKPIDVDTFAQTVESFILNKDLFKATTDSASRLVERKGLNSAEREDSSSALAELRPIAPVEPVNTDEREEVEQFIYRVSHDLQSPLRKIRQFSSFLKVSAKDELKPENYVMLEALDRAVNQMNELLSDLLLLSRIGRMEGQLSTFSIQEVVQEAMRENQATIDELHAEIELGGMLPLEGHYQQLVQLFYQLIQNSLKYHSKKDPPHIRIECHQAVDNAVCIEITIADNGLGFKKEYADKIFQPLQRLHGVTKYPGTGVGLAIVKKIIERHQGSIHADSQPDQGTTFTIRLPLRQNENAFGA
jgi:signal transduction histidine kinase